MRSNALDVLVVDSNQRRISAVDARKKFGFDDIDEEMTQEEVGASLVDA